MNIDAYLGKNKYEVDEGNPHIQLVASPPAAAFNQLVKLCPAGLYKVDADAAQTFDFAGCLECGTCRVAASGTVVKEWRYPGPTMGVEYRYG